MHLLMAGFTAAMLVFYMHQTAVRRFEGYRTYSALIEDLTMLLLNVILQEGQWHEKHFTMQTPEGNCIWVNQRGGEREMTTLKRFEECHWPWGHSSRYLRVPNFTGIMETIFFHMLLDVRRATKCPTFRTAIRGFVCVNALMGLVAALVGKQHWANLAHLHLKKANTRVNDSALECTWRTQGNTNS